MILDMPIKIGTITVPNRLVMPPMQTNKTDMGHVTDALVEYYRERSVGSRPGIVIMEHSCITSNARAAEKQLSIAADENIAEHQRLTDAIHEGGGMAFVQLNHAGSNGIDESVSAGPVNIPTKKIFRKPRPLTVDEIHEIKRLFAEAAIRALKAGYDGVEIHSAHGYLLDEFYSPITNKREDEYGGNLKNRMRFLLETVAAVRAAIGADVPLSVRLGGADYLPGGAKEEDAAEAAVMLEKAGIDLLDISGGMCFYMRPGHMEPGWFSSMTEKIKAKTAMPVLLSGGIKKVADAKKLLEEGKSDLIGVARGMLKDPMWRENA